MCDSADSFRIWMEKHLIVFAQKSFATENQTADLRWHTRGIYKSISIFLHLYFFDISFPFLSKLNIYLLHFIAMEINKICIGRRRE